MKNRRKPLSKEGLELLADKELCTLLSAAAESIGVSAEEYLIRFEEVLRCDPSALMVAFEKSNLSLDIM